MSSSTLLYDAFVSDPLHLDLHPGTWQAWLRGITQQELIHEITLSLQQHYQQPTVSTPQHRHTQPRPRTAHLARRHRPSVSSSSSSASSSPSSLPRALSSPFNASPATSRRPSATGADPALVPRTIISTLSALTVEDDAASPAPADLAAVGVGDVAELSDGDDEDSSDELTSSSFSSSAYSRLLLSTQQNVHSQYRTFALLEPYLRQPSLLSLSPPLFQLTPPLLTSLTSLYYSIDPPFFLLLAGLKLKSLTRSDVDLFSHRAGLRPQVGWRMYENMRRMYRVRWPEGDEEVASDDADARVGSVSRNASMRWKQMRVVAATAVGKMRAGVGGGGEEDDDGRREGAAEELHSAQQSTTAFFASHFVLPLALARAYTRLVFLSRHRLQASGKRLTAVTYDDMQAIAHILMEKWCWRVGEGEANPTTPLAEPSRRERQLSTTTLERQLFSTVTPMDDASTLTVGTVSGTVHLRPPSPVAPSPSAARTAPPASMTLHLLSPIHGAMVSPTSDDEIGDALDLELIAELRSTKVHIADHRRLLDDYVTSILLLLRELSTQQAPARSSPSHASEMTPVSSSPSASSASSFAFPSTPISSLSAVPLRPLLLEKLRPRVLPLVRSLLSLAASLSKAKRVRLLLPDLAEEVCRPMQKLGLSPGEMTTLMEAMVTGWEALAEVKKEINLLRQRLREGMAKGAVGGHTVYGDEVARSYLHWMRFLSAVVPITGLLYRRMGGQVA